MIVVVANENNPDGVAAAIDTLASPLSSNCTLIFGMSFGHQFVMTRSNIQSRYPNARFVTLGGYMTNEHMSAGFGRMEQARYLTGLVAGLMTKTNRICYVGAFRVAQVYRYINGFANGVYQVNTNAVIDLVWINTWADYPLQALAANW